MLNSARVHFWIATAALSLAAALTAAAQEPAPAQGTDVFANTSTGYGTNSDVPIYEDQFSSNCDKQKSQAPVGTIPQQGGTPFPNPITRSIYVDGYDPAVCVKYPRQPGYPCFPSPPPLGVTDAGQSADTCYTCSSPNMAGKQIVIAQDLLSQLGIPSYAWICAVNSEDGQCYLSCFGDIPNFTPPPGVTEISGKTGKELASGGPPTKFQLQISNTPGPCEPAGPTGPNICDYPNVPRPPGCTCSKTPGPQASTQPTPKPTPQPATPSTSQPPDEAQYLMGIVDGLGDCLKNLQTSMLGLMAGAGYFAQGDFVQASQMWGLQPGQSIYLKAIWADLNTPIISTSTNKVTAYSRGVIDGKRICQYILLPAAKQIAKSALKGGVGTTGGTTPAGPATKIASTGGKPAQLPGSKGGASPKLPGGTSTSGTSPPPQLPGSSGGAPPKLPSAGGTPSAIPPAPTPPSLPGFLPSVPDNGAGGVPAAPVNNGGVPAPANGGSSGSGPNDVSTTKPSTPGAGSEAAGGGDGSSAKTPYFGGLLQSGLNGDPNNPEQFNPKDLGDKYVQLQKGPVLLGDFIDNGSFADVYKYNGDVMKLSRNGTGPGSYGPASIKGQLDGAQRLQGTGVQFPTVDADSFQPGDANNPASLVTRDAKDQFPGYEPITRADFQKMPAAQQQAILDAQNKLTNAAAAKGLVLVDTNTGNVWFKQNGNSYDAMLVDTDMVMTPQEIQNSFDAFNAAVENPALPGSVPGSVFVTGVVYGNGLSLLGSLPSASAQQITDVLNQGRANRFMTPLPAANPGGGEDAPE